MLRPTFAVLAVVATMLITAGPAGATITYNGHAGYQHNQTDLEFLADITDGTSNTLAVGELIVAMPRQR